MHAKTETRTRSSGGHNRQQGTLLLLLFLLFSLLQLPGSSLVAAAPAPPLTANIKLSIEGLSTATITNQPTVVISGTITNDSGTDLRSVVLQGSAHRRPIITTEGVDRWFAGDNKSTLRDIGSQTLPAVPAHAKTPFALTCNTEVLRTGDWGPRGLEVTLQTGGASASESVSDRTLVLVAPTTSVKPTELTVVAPFTYSGNEVAQANNTGVPVSTLAHNRLQGLLSLTSRPAVSLAVDPATIDPKPTPALVGDLLATRPKDVTGLAPYPAADRLEHGDQLRNRLYSGVEHATSRFLLPWSNPDIAGLTHHGNTEILEAARARTATMSTGFQAGGNPIRTDIELPPITQLDTKIAGVLGGRTAIVPDTGLTANSNFLPSAKISYFDTGQTVSESREQAATGPQKHGLLIANGELARLLQSPAGDTATELDLAQRLRARLAQITNERPNDPRSVVVVLERNTSFTPALGERIDALSSGPWVKPVPIDTAVDSPLSEVSRATPVKIATSPNEIGGEELTALTATLQTARALPVVGSRKEVNDSIELAVLSWAAVAWNDSPSGHFPTRVQAENLEAALRTAVVAQPPPLVNLIDAEVRIPVPVTNRLPVPVKIVVSLKPGDARLRAPAQVTLTLPPKGQATAALPATAIGAGDMDVRVVLRDGDGKPLPEPKEEVKFQVRMRPSVEGWGTTLGFSMVALLLIGGIIRTVQSRRGRGFAPNTAPEGVPINPSEPTDENLTEGPQTDKAGAADLTEPGATTTTRGNSADWSAVNEERKP